MRIHPLTTITKQHAKFKIVNFSWTFHCFLLLILVTNVSMVAGQPQQSSERRKQRRQRRLLDSPMTQGTQDANIPKSPYLSSSSLSSTTAATTTKTVDEIPSFDDTMEFAALSTVVYLYHHLEYTSCTEQAKDGLTPTNSTIKATKDAVVLPENVTCEMYEHNQKQGTEVLIVTSTSKNYIAVIYCGTDDVATGLIDGEFIKTKFGGSDDPNIWVHDGFNNAVFDDGIYDRVLAKVMDLREEYPGYRIVTAGHSMGAANAVLTAAAFTQQLNLSSSFAQEEDDDAADEVEKILVITFGCPRIGNTNWRHFVDSNPHLNVWRFVLGKDIVPRVPPELFFYYHVGHIAQMSDDKMVAYYSQHGNKKLGYKGVPFGWDMWPLVWIPGAFGSHFMEQYKEYFETKTKGHLDTHYIHDYEKMDVGERSGDDVFLPLNDGDVSGGDVEVESSFSDDEGFIPFVIK